MKADVNVDKLFWNVMKKPECTWEFVVNDDKKLVV